MVSLPSRSVETLAPTGSRGHNIGQASGCDVSPVFQTTEIVSDSFLKSDEIGQSCGIVAGRNRFCDGNTLETLHY
jgi:hypothetical protein